MNCFFAPLQTGSITDTEHPAPRGWAGNFFFSQYWGSCLTLPALPLSVSLPLRHGLLCPPPPANCPALGTNQPPCQLGLSCQSHPSHKESLVWLLVSFQGYHPRIKGFFALNLGELCRWCFFFLFLMFSVCFCFVFSSVIW